MQNHVKVEGLIVCKVKENTRWWVSLAVGLVLACAGAIYAYGQLNERVGNNCKRLDTLEHYQRSTHDMVKEMHGYLKAKGM